MFHIFPTVFSFIACVAALHTPQPAFILHEKRTLDALPGRTRIDPESIIQMRIGLQQNEHALTAASTWLMDVSDPDSPNYGLHWEQSAVIDAFQPSAQTIQTVTKWLHSYNILNFTHSDNKLWFVFDIAAGRAEEMLRTKFWEHPAREAPAFEAECDEYYLPEGVGEHVDYVVPGVMPGDVTGRTERSRKLLAEFVADQRGLQKSAASKRLAEEVLDGPVDKDNLTHCSTKVTPACIRALYNIPLADPNQPVSPNNSLGIFAAYHQAYNQQNLDALYKHWTDVPVHTAPIDHPIDGGGYAPNLTHGPQSIYTRMEADADVEISQPIVYPQNITFWDLSRPHDFGTENYFNRLLDAFDGSYCTYEQRKNFANGGKPVCGIFQPTNIISFSYAWAESFFPSKLWQHRQCNEYLKLGLQGVSLFFSSGDYGTWDTQTVYPMVCRNGSLKHADRVFQPDFPPACPWVTSVGGTRLKDGDTVTDRQIGWPSSGGGFSIQWERPSYQTPAIKHWQATTNSTIPYFYNGVYNHSTNGSYNRNGKGVPDFAASAVAVWLKFQTGFSRFTGTSASAPLGAAIFNRINEERIRAGKSRVGFVNPALYKNPQAFVDILEGTNGVCGPNSGFYCQPGWDPVTGLGAPDYEKLLDVFMKLP